MIKPQTKVPELTVMTVDGELWNINEQNPENFTVVVFYRGYHCPICKPYLQELDSKLDKFAEYGVNVIAISSNPLDLAQQTKKEWELGDLKVGYGLPLDVARNWGLFISRAIKESEQDEFSEPGLFVIRPDGTLYASSVQTMPFARPKFDELLGALHYVIKNDYPARGEA